jgi:hypothetical protein
MVMSTGIAQTAKRVISNLGINAHIVTNIETCSLMTSSTINAFWMTIWNSLAIWTANIDRLYKRSS